MRFLLIGDIVGNDGVSFLHTHLGTIKTHNKIDYVIANGENSTPVGKGLSRSVADTLYNCGVDVITMGNHTYNNREIFSLFDDGFPVIRPANLPSSAEGIGYYTDNVCGVKVGVINLIGRVFLDNSDCPFKTADTIIDKIKNETDIIIVDFHAEATSEKIAMGFYLDGRVSAVFGTHTHVQTADEKILENGTAYITDAGMTGCHDSVLGIKKEIIIKKFLTCVPQRHEVESGTAAMDGVIVDIDENTGKALSIERIQIS